MPCAKPKFRSQARAESLDLLKTMSYESRLDSVENPCNGSGMRSGRDNYNGISNGYGLKMKRMSADLGRVNMRKMWRKDVALIRIKIFEWYEDASSQGLAAPTYNEIVAMCRQVTGDNSRREKRLRSAAVSVVGDILVERSAGRSR